MSTQVIPTSSTPADVPASPTPDHAATRATSPAFMVVALAVWSVVVAVSASFVTWRVLDHQLQADLAMRPPVVVLNTFGWIKHSGTGQTIEQRYESGAERLRAVIAQLRKHGALVLDESAVRAAPPQVLLKTPRGQ